MRIWIDFINTPQVSFFEPLMEELKSLGHEFVLTCRDSSNTVQLLNQKGWDFQVIGSGSKKTLISKLIAFPGRILDLRKFLKNKKIDLALGQSSFYLPLTARSLNIRSIYTNDNEHALGNIPSFLFADTIFLPSELSLKKALSQGASKKKITQYPGIKEGIYLWKKALKIKSLREKNKQNKIYIRPEPVSAQYYKGKENFLDKLISELSSQYQVVVLTRGTEQANYYTRKFQNNVTVPEKPLDFLTVATDCLAFIGAGGSMTREMAILGIPTISVYQAELLDVDRFLINEGLLVFAPRITSQEVIDFTNKTENNLNKSEKILEKGKTAYNLLKYSILGNTK